MCTLPYLYCRHAHFSLEYCLLLLSLLFLTIPSGTFFTYAYTTMKNVHAPDQYVRCNHLENMDAFFSSDRVLFFYVVFLIP